MYYDYIILGAGINGAAVARALAQKGKRVAIIEKSHVGAGASSHSSRLIHGGLRYLESFEFALVFESLHDRAALIARYPDLVTLKPFLLPVYSDSPRPRWMIKIGLFLYDLLSSFSAPFQTVALEAVQKQYPALDRTKMKGAFYYFDAKTSDIALTQTIVDEACEYGATLLEKTHIERIELDEGYITLTTKEHVMTTQHLINATGPWMDEVNAAYNLPSRFSIDKVSGIHIVLEGLLTPTPMLLQEGKKRIFFIIPEVENNQTLIGTTERREAGLCDDVVVNEEDITYLLNAVNPYLKRALTREDVKSSFIGIRPLVASKNDMNKTSREYQLDLHYLGKSKLLHIYGGKLTTHASLAKKVLRKLKVQ